MPRIHASLPPGEINIADGPRSLTLREAIEIFATKAEMQAFVGAVRESNDRIDRQLTAMQISLDAIRATRLPGWLIAATGPLLAVLVSYVLSHFFIPAMPVPISNRIP